MAKTSKSSSTLNLNGQPLVSSTVSKSGIENSYYMPENLQKAYDFALGSLAENMPNINVFSPQVINQLNEQVKAFQAKGIKNINQIYEPMLKSVREDAARRFGNINNSVFMDNLNNLESKRAEAVSDLSQDVAAKRNELINNELANRYDYLNFLNSFQNQTYNNALSALGLNNSYLNASLNAANAANNRSQADISNYIKDAMAAMAIASKFMV